MRAEQRFQNLFRNKILFIHIGLKVFNRVFKRKTLADLQYLNKMKQVRNAPVPGSYL